MDRLPLAARPRFDPTPVLRASRVRIGKQVRLQGVPAILVGVATIVVAAGAARALSRLSATLPEAVREIQALAERAGAERKSLR